MLESSEAVRWANLLGSGSLMKVQVEAGSNIKEFTDE